MTKSTLSTTARSTLAAAAARDDRVALPPERLPAAARRAVVQSLLKTGLLEEIAAEDDQAAWRTAEGGERCALHITDAGLSAVGAETADTLPEPARRGPQEAQTASAAPHAPEQAEVAQDAPTRAPVADTRPKLRAAAQAAVTAWGDATEGRPDLPAAMDA